MDGLLFCVAVAALCSLVLAIYSLFAWQARRPVSETILSYLTALRRFVQSIGSSVKSLF